MKLCYIVCFQIADKSNLETFKGLLKSTGFFCPITETAWAIKTEKKAAETRDWLSSLIGPNDRLFVVRSGTEAAWKNSFGEKHSKWLKDNL